MEKPKENPNKQSITTEDLEQAGIDLNLFDQDFLLKIINEYVNKKGSNLDIQKTLQKIKTLQQFIRNPGQRAPECITLNLSNHPDFAEVRNGRHRILFFKYKGSETQITRYYCVCIDLEKDTTHRNFGSMEKLLRRLRQKVLVQQEGEPSRGSAFRGKKGKEG